MSNTFTDTNNISMSNIITFINNNSNQNIGQSNVSLRNVFDIMRQESFQPQQGDFFVPDKFSEMRGMYGFENQVPTITLNGQSTVTVIAGDY